MNWHELKPGDTVVGETSGGAYTLLRIEPSRYFLGSDRLSFTMLNLETSELYTEDVSDGPIHFFEIFRVNE